MRCEWCGASDNTISINRHKIIGKYNGEKVTETVNICICCDAWGVLDDEEKLKSMTDLDEPRLE